MTAKITGLLLLVAALAQPVVAQPQVAQLEATQPKAAQQQRLTSDRGATTIAYHLHHPLHEVDAVSKSALLRIDCDPAAKVITAVEAEVDVTSFDSGNSNRDSHAMEVVDALSFPDVTFNSTSVSRQGDSLTVAGKLTFHGITREITARGMADWSGGRIALDAHFNISLTDFKIERPSLLMMPVADTLRFTLNAVFNLTQ